MRSVDPLHGPSYQFGERLHQFLDLALGHMVFPSGFFQGAIYPLLKMPAFLVGIFGKTWVSMVNTSFF